MGNRLTKVDSIEETITYDYNANDGLLTETEENGEFKEYEYDDNGNTIKVIEDSAETIYEWDKENRLVSVTLSDGTEINYEYDVNNIRTSQEVNGVRTDYLVDSNQTYAQVLEEYVDRELEVSYVYGLDLISQERGTEISIYLVDWLGSTRVLTNENGLVISSYDYDAFGNLINSNSSVENNYLFAGEQFDENLGESYLRQRYYDAEIGRFTRRDVYEGRINEPVTLHKYLYANGNPVNFTDPTGLYTLTEFSAGQAIVDALLVSVTVGFITAYVAGRTTDDWILLIKGEQLRGNTERLAEHIARLLREAEIGGVPSGEPPEPGNDNDDHWWTEIKTFIKNARQALKAKGNKLASRKQALRELTKNGKFTEAQVKEIESKLVEAANRVGQPAPDFLPPP